ncbi:hypothetical protein Pelo_14889 [Pelomyxa schiedti]|nr:hypothetical protein Pelo_14889 [Pelomyxa schiedti]
MSYPLWKRRSVLHRLTLPDTTATDLAKEAGVSVSTIYRWWNSGVSFVPHAGGRPMKMSFLALYALCWLELMYPTVSREEACQFLKIVTGEDVNRATKKLGFVLRFTVGKIIGERNEAARQAWFSHTIFNNPPGIFGLPIEVLIDLDEMGCDLLSTVRRMGHSLVGQAVRTPMPAQSKRFSLIMAADVNQGAVAPWVFPKTLCTSIFYLWLKFMLLPALLHQHRVILMDNHRAHLATEIFDLVKSQGHLLIPRPHSSPDLAWIENCFAEIKRNLRVHQGLINASNLEQYLYSSTTLISPHLVQKFTSGCHYLVPGLTSHPY